MKKCTFLFFFTIVFFNQKTAGQNRKSLDFSMGPSFFIWYFQDADFSDSKMLGYRADLQFSYKSSKRLGFTTLLRGQSTTKNSGKRFPSEFEYDGPLNSLSLLSGISGEFRLSEKLTLNANLMLGFILLSYPERRRNSSNHTIGQNKVVDRTKLTGGGYGGIISSGLKYDIKPKLYLNLKADISLGYIPFQWLPFPLQDPGNTSFSIGFCTFNPSLGIGVHF